MISILKMSSGAALASFAAWAGVSLLCRGVDIAQSVALGLFLSWVISTASVFVLTASRRFSMKTFLWAWFGGMAARIFILGVLMAISWHWMEASQAALLLSYAFGVIISLFVESRAMASQEVLA
jgi:hypothetical protein